jgi:hypothetical protein|nr:MAG TPA: hypothetical protein [Caudoviricetes sp.]
MTYSKKQLMEKLDAMGAQYDPEASVQELDQLYRELKTATAPVDEGTVHSLDDADTTTESTDEADIESKEEDSPDDSESVAEELVDTSKAEVQDDMPVNAAPVIMVRQTCKKLYLRSTPEKVSGNEVAILLGGREYAAREIGEEWTYLFGMDGYVASAFIEEADSLSS